MITLTGPAVEAIRTLSAKHGLPDSGGLRIWHSDTAGSITINMADGPYDGDEIVEADGVRVFLNPDASTMLHGKELDAVEDEIGLGFQIGIPDRIIL